MSDQELWSELRRFLKDRRARINPADVGIAPTGRRRVRGGLVVQIPDLASKARLDAG